jgi:hypothetical protein
MTNIIAGVIHQFESQNFDEFRNFKFASPNSEYALTMNFHNISRAYFRNGRQKQI